MVIFKWSIIFFVLFPYILFSMPLFWWKPVECTNFGDELSCVIVERILDYHVQRAQTYERKFLALGSILHFAFNNDVVWGAGINGKHQNSEDYSFTYLDIRAVRGPLTREFLCKMGIECPEVYGDPGLLMARLFPEFKVDPKTDYIVIPHISEIDLFIGKENVVFPTETWDVVVRKIIESKLVISSSLHGIIVAEAFGVPARLLRVTCNEPIFKYIDYYRGSGRNEPIPAHTISEALEMGGEPPAICDLDSLLDAFPYDCFNEI